MEYLLKVSAVVAIFYLSYKIFLQRETFFEQNRWFLLMGLITAFLLPFLVIPIYVEATPLDFSNYVFETTTTVENPEKPFNIIDYLPIAYGLGVLFFSVQFLVQFASLSLVIFKNKAERISGYRYIKTTHKISPFSFFKWIVYNPEQFSSSEVEQIITHEKVHANQLHSLDILLTHLGCIVLWFNPFIWLYNKDLKQNLEFIADNIASTKTDCKKSYQYTLLKTSMPSHQMALSNPFYNSLIKKRIVMLHKSKSKKINLIKYALVMPILALFLMSFNTKEIPISPTSKNIANTSYPKDHIEVIISKDFTDKDMEDLKLKLKSDGYTVKFKDINRNADNEISAIKIELSSKKSTANYSIAGDEAIKPIKISLKDGIVSIGSGNITKEKRMVFESEDGQTHEVTYTTTDKKIVVINSDSAKKDVETEEIIIKKGETGKKIKKVITTKTNGEEENAIITDSEHEEEEDINRNTTKETKIKIISTKKDSPLIILDGKEINHGDMNMIDPNSIEKVEVLKDNNATKLYGDKGKNGVVLITSKKNKWETQFIVRKPFDSIPKKDSSSKYSVKLSDEALYKINGKEVKKTDVDKLNSDDIESINVYKGHTAINKYGEKAKNGVVEIVTKKKE
ncbi:M56 family metallopeptidase [Mariniflexile sp.]|uniref:M56 family metallopeptidase n=1 Tax=Mariniflexile sp. TaxID=1979402 RepID=UPI00356463A4